MKEGNELSTGYKNSLVATYVQLEIDIALSLLKLSPAQIRKVIDLSDRKYDCAKDQGYDFVNIVYTKDDKYYLRFEGWTGDFSYFGISELSTEDKIYLLELIKKI